MCGPVPSSSPVNFAEAPSSVAVSLSGALSVPVGGGGSGRDVAGRSFPSVPCAWLTSPAKASISSAEAPARPGERVPASLADPPCRGVNKLSARIGLSPSVH